ncbi:hypothetical protein Hrd1104_04810 [Halorhabdus sp. CBA1104]|nr:hypothetical protein Hrd1104_04810 [Halorhabdus sp. CBA1104]
MTLRLEGRSVSGDQFRAASVRAGSRANAFHSFERYSVETFSSSCLARVATKLRAGNLGSAQMLWKYNYQTRLRTTTLTYHLADSQSTFLIRVIFLGAQKTLLHPDCPVVSPSGGNMFKVVG